MAGTDAASSLPVRTVTNGDVVAFLADGTTPSQLAAIDSHGSLSAIIRDTSGAPITSQANGSARALDVGINVAGVQIDPRVIRALTSADVVTAAQGAAAASHTGFWWTRITDGVNDVVLAPASTAATLTQAALVVALSPNSPLPAGTNAIGSVNQGTSPWITKDQSDGPVAPGAAASFSQLIGGEFSSSLPTLTNGQQAALQSDSSGRLLIGSIGSALPAGTNTIGSVNQGTSPWVTSDLADGSATGGTAGSKSLLSGLIYNSSAPTLTTGQQAGLQGDVSGNLKVNIAAGSLDVGVADKTAFTYGTTIFQPVGGVYQDTAPTLTTGTTGAARLTTNRALHTNLRTSAGVEITAQANGLQEALDVGINVLGVQIDPRQIRALTSADVVTAAQGAAGIASGAWFSKITDGTNTAAVKAASTAAAATDPALVVGFSPNSPLPAGTNLIGNANAYQAGAANTNSNPFFVAITNTTPGTPVNYYNATSNIAVAATDTTSLYTITTGKVLSIKKVFISSSIRVRADFQVSTNGTVFTTVFSTFTSTAGGFSTFDTDEISIADSGTGSAVRVVFTNEDIKVSGAYATILGTEN